MSLVEVVLRERKVSWRRGGLLDFLVMWGYCTGL